jgi:hypothetical protein
MASLYHHVYAKIRLRSALTHFMSLLESLHSSLGTYFSWRCRNLKFELRFCDAVSISSCIRQVVFAIKNPTTQCFNALHELSNETSLVSGDLFSWRCWNLKFKLCFCDAVSISSCICQVAFAIKNPTTQCFNALHELSNETSLVSGDLFFMKMLKFEVQTPFLCCRQCLVR